MARLYSDLLDGSGRRYYFGLNSAPGGITNAEPARLILFGREAAVQEQATVFRTPATAVLTLTGYSAAAEPRLQPVVAGLALQGLVPVLHTVKVITNALPPDYTALPDNAPTILFIQTISPARAVLTLQSLEHNITQGGNIGFINPGVAILSIVGHAPNFPRMPEVGAITVNGLAATILTTLQITPDPAEIKLGELAASCSLPFGWVDDGPAPATGWIDDPRA